MKLFFIRAEILASSALASCLFASGIDNAKAQTSAASSWSTCYAGVQAGTAKSNSRWSFTNSNPYSATGNADPITLPGVSFDDSRGIIGLQSGCNRAISESWLIGLEGAWFSNPMNNHNAKPGFFPDPGAFPTENEVVTTDIKSVFSLTGKLGMAATPDWLVYVKGGYAVAKIATSGTVTPAFDPAIFDFVTTGWHSGWTVGAGIEYRLFRNVTIGAEYNYYRFNNVAHSGAVSAIDFVGGVGSPANPVNHAVSADMQTVMARVNFQLNPTVAVADSNASSAYAAYLKAPPAAVNAATFSAFSNSELRFSSWNGTRGANVFSAASGSGHQYYSPTTIGVDYDLPSEYKLETRFKGGYVYASQNTAGQVARYEGPIDTQASFNLTFLSFDSIRPLLGLSLNLPTGNSYLPGNQRFTRMDPDLVDVGVYGAGFNANPTAGFVFGINENTAVSVSAGYAWQGDFTREGINIREVANPAPPPNTIVVSTFDQKQRVTPGGTYTLNANVTSNYGNLALATSFAYMGSSHASLDGVSSGKVGADYTVNSSLTYQFDDRAALALNATWNFKEKNDIPNGFGGLIPESSNSNSNVVIASVDPSYLVADNIKVAGNYSYLYRDHNFYSQLQDQFVAAKQKHTAGGSVTYALSQEASFTFRGSHSWVRQDDGPLLITGTAPPILLALQPPALHYKVWAGSIAANVTF